MYNSSHPVKPTPEFRVHLQPRHSSTGQLTRKEQEDAWTTWRITDDSHNGYLYG